MTWLRTHLYAILAGAKAVLLAVVYFKGRQDANRRREAEQLRAQHGTRKRIDQVVRDTDQLDAVDFLRDRARK